MSRGQPVSGQRWAAPVGEGRLVAEQHPANVSASQPRFPGQRGPGQPHVGVDGQLVSGQRVATMVRDGGRGAVKSAELGVSKDDTAVAAEPSAEVERVEHPQSPGGQPGPQAAATKADTWRLRVRQIQRAQITLRQLQRAAQRQPAQVQPADDLRPPQPHGYHRGGQLWAVPGQQLEQDLRADLAVLTPLPSPGRVVLTRSVRPKIHQSALGRLGAQLPLLRPQLRGLQQTSLSCWHR
jgi:hypothetical protein